MKMDFLKNTPVIDTEILSTNKKSSLFRIVCDEGGMATAIQVVADALNDVIDYLKHTVSIGKEIETVTKQNVVVYRDGNPYTIYILDVTNEEEILYV